MWQKELCTCFSVCLFPPQRLLEDLRISEIPQHLACRINLLSWKALAWLGLAQLNSNLNTDPALHKLLFYKEGLISQSSVQSGAFRLNWDNYIHYRQPWLSIQRRILFQFIISRVPTSSVSIRKYLAFMPRGTKGVWPIPCHRCQLPAASPHQALLLPPLCLLSARNPFSPLGKNMSFLIPSPDMQSPDSMLFLYLPVACLL